jgi:hypothetical protein
MDTAIIELPTEYWSIVRQVLEQSLTAKGSDGARMLHEIYLAFDAAGIVLMAEEVSTLPILDNITDL